MINGFIVIDKPAGITSHDVVSRARRILGTRKIGHTGTLDPFATGVLPIAVNDGTKVIPFLDEGNKTYEAVMQLGVVTDSLDLTGSVMQETDWHSVTQASVETVFKSFTGQISQIPPMFSAIKMGGLPLYKLARQGKTIERNPREIAILSLELLSFAPPFIGFRVTCSRGTYVRTLADDIGRTLECGAALKHLRRTASGPFLMSMATTLDELAAASRDGSIDGMTVNPSAALSHLPDFTLNDAGLLRVSHGRSPGLVDLIAPDFHDCRDGDLVRLSKNGQLIAVASCRTSAGDVPSLVLKRVFHVS